MPKCDLLQRTAQPIRETLRYGWLRPYYLAPSCNGRALATPAAYGPIFLCICELQGNGRIVLRGADSCAYA